MAASTRAFVLRHTRLRPVLGLEEIRLHLADEVAAAVACRPGRDARPRRRPAVLGLRLGRRSRDRPLPARSPRGRGRTRVFDLASGSGLCAIAAARRRRDDGDRRRHRPVRGRGDRAVNARANGRRVSVVASGRPGRRAARRRRRSWPATAGTRPTRRAGPAVAAPGTRSRDRRPGRRPRSPLPADRTSCVELAAYDVRTTTELEDLERKEAWVYALRPVGLSPG